MASSWQSPELDGESYLEEDALTCSSTRRCVFMRESTVVDHTMAVGRTALTAARQSQSFGIAEFYAEEDCVTRSASFVPDTLPRPSPLRCRFGDDGYAESEAVCKGAGVTGRASANENSLGAVRFMGHHSAPDLPKEPLYKLMVTTMYVRCRNSYEIGNHILDFLDEEVSSTLKKVNHSKCCAKADVFSGFTMCTVKIRVFSVEPMRFAIEFQRRAGDPITFNETFAKAEAFLKLRLETEECSIEVTPSLALSSPMSGSVYSSDDTDLWYILDMANCEGAELLVAEAATVLCQIAAEGKMNLCRPCVFESLGKLWKSNSAMVAHPTSLLTWHLAQCPDAAPLFAAHGLLLQMLDKVLSSDTHTQVCKQLAEALAVAAALQQQSKSTLSHAGAVGLFHALTNLFDTDPAEPRLNNISQEVKHSLERAHLALRNSASALGCS